MFISWNKKFETGIEEIDRQHKNLFDIAERLYQAKKGDYKNLEDRVDETVKELLSYAEIHFKTEEKMMEKCGYEGFGEHRAIHNKFKDKARKYEMRIDESRGDLFLATEMMNFLIDWMIGHVSVTDMEYVECVKANCEDA